VALRMVGRQQPLCRVIRRGARVTLFSTAGNHPPHERKKADMDAPTGSLYDRLGGIYNIATVVDDFIDRIMVDQRLNANPRVDEAHHRVLPPGFKYLVTEMLAEAVGGPQRYSGRSMVDSHRELQITPEEWGAFMDDLNHTLDKFDVPQQERSEVVAIVESTRDDIVVG
jgi:hemoglobin